MPVQPKSSGCWLGETDSHSLFPEDNLSYQVPSRNCYRSSIWILGCCYRILIFSSRGPSFVPGRGFVGWASSPPSSPFFGLCFLFCPQGVLCCCCLTFLPHLRLYFFEGSGVSCECCQTNLLIYFIEKLLWEV